MLNLTKSTVGKLMMRTWFLRPSVDIDVINQRYDTIEWMLRPSLQVLFDEVREVSVNYFYEFFADPNYTKCLKKVKNVQVCIFISIIMSIKVYCNFSIVENICKEPEETRSSGMGYDFQGSVILPYPPRPPHLFLLRLHIFVFSVVSVCTQDTVSHGRHSSSRGNIFRAH